MRARRVKTKIQADSTSSSSSNSSTLPEPVIKRDAAPRRLPINISNKPGVLKVISSILHEQVPSPFSLLGSHGHAAHFHVRCSRGVVASLLWAAGHRRLLQGFQCEHAQYFRCAIVSLPCISNAEPKLTGCGSLLRSAYFYWQTIVRGTYLDKIRPALYNGLVHGPLNTA